MLLDPIMSEVVLMCSYPVLSLQCWLVLYMCLLLFSCFQIIKTIIELRVAVSLFCKISWCSERQDLVSHCSAASCVTVIGSEYINMLAIPLYYSLKILVFSKPVKGTLLVQKTFMLTHRCRQVFRLSHKHEPAVLTTEQVVRDVVSLGTPSGNSLLFLNFPY